MFPYFLIKLIHTQDQVNFETKKKKMKKMKIDVTPS